ncbi:hypothetical protein [Pseudodesulfovibrio profundus]|uniref:hypothetical protein n=1 Tax=Pseudodesulfovibrio profundus TaxID=57320 RepID=UPI0012FF840F|nr:hypothetical protein [Pseudodesulfovibrio profundus]
MKKTQASRDKYFIFLILIVTVFASQFESSQLAKDIAVLFISKKSDLSDLVVFQYFTSFLWFGLTLLTVKYCQTHVHLERQYKYIQALEDKLQSHFNDDIFFTREGKSYFSKHPFSSEHVSLLFRRVFPVAFIYICSERLLIDVEWGGLFRFIRLKRTSLREFP